MSTARAVQNGQSTRDGQRRRRNRTGGRHTPEPKNIVSGAGQPLDLSVRRELEERLGYDFGQVRLHTDRDADALTGLLGADAVAVGRDIFFRAGAYRPGTTDGRRLLAHELLHTVQDPHGLGALKAGRYEGAVSLPSQPAERTAEDTARTARSPEDVDVEPAAPTPGWMRYATVTADQLRAERLDPATLPDRLAATILRSLRGDPADWSRRTRNQLALLPDELVEPVLDRLENRLLTPEYERVLDILDGVEDRDDLEFGAHDAPEPEPDVAERLRQERQTAYRQAVEEQQRQRRPAPAPGPEKEQYGPPGAAGSTPPNVAPWSGLAGYRNRPGGGGASHKEQGGASPTPAGQQPAAGPAAPAPAPAEIRQESAVAQPEPPAPAPASGEAGAEKAADSEASAQRETPVVSPEESAARNRPGAAEPRVAARQVKPEDRLGTVLPTGSPAVSGKDTQLKSAASTLDPVRNQDAEGLEEPADEPMPDTVPSEVEVGGAEKSAWDITLQPEDFLPAQDPDVSGIPTADTMDPTSTTTPPMPSFPAPPVTRADQVQAERDAEDAEDEAAQAEADQEPAEPAPLLPGTEAEPTAEAPAEPLPEPTAETPPGPGTTVRDPASGADPKAGPVDAQTTVQDVAGRSEGGGTQAEQAAKEERGTPAVGDKTPAAPEKAAQQPVSGQASAPDPVPRAAQNSPAASEPTSGTSGGTGSPPATTAPESAATPAPAPAPTEATLEPALAPALEPTAAQATPPPAPEPAPPVEQPATREAATTAPASEAPGPEVAPASRSTAPAGRTSRAGGGGGDGTAAGPVKKAQDSEPAPNLATVSPEAGLATAAKLKPHRALESMTGVGQAADRSVGDEHKTLAAAPPGMQRPAGAPQTLSGDPKTAAPVRYSTDPANRSDPPDKQKAEVTGAKEPEGPIEAEKEEGPSGWDTFKMALGFGLGKLANLVGIDVDAQELAAKFAGLPTKDEALKQAMAGNAPGVQMGDAAQQTSGEQGTAVDTKGQDTVEAGRDDAGRGMGEDQVYPDVPPERMEAQVPGREGGAPVAAGGAPTGAVPADAASKVAEHDNGPRIQTAFQQGQQGMSQGRQAKDQGFRDGQTRHRAKVSTEITVNTKSQKAERDGAFGDVTAQRAAWRKDQDAELSKLDTKKTDRQAKVRKDVDDREKKTDDDVEHEKTGSDKKIQDKATTAEQDANKERDGAVQDSGNWVSRAFDWIKQKVIEIKNAIVRVIKAARDAVVGFIKDFKDTVERWINDARTFIVDTIKKLIDDLIAFAKAMVQAVIDLANRIRALITDLINAAIDLVNKLAAALKQIIKDLLNALGKLLADLLRILLKALLDVIRATIEAIKQVLALASQLLGMLGTFLFVAIDFLSDPGGWLSGAKNSAVDGAKHHLFREVKSAVKQWFQQKIEDILGVGKEVFNILFKGGFSLERIVKETWDAIVPMLPFIIGEIVITKVIAKLIPGAGWVMAVIDAIRVAIGSLGAILRAMGAVLAWLISVRKGGAGLLFAKAVAAGIVALLELAYQALLDGIGKYVAKVGKRLKGIAARMAKGQKRGAPPRPPRRGGEPEPAARRPGEPTTRRPEETPRAAPRPVTPGRPGTTPRPRPSAGPRPDGRPPARPGERPAGALDRPPGRPDRTPAAGRPDAARPDAARPDAAGPGRPSPTLSPATAPRKPPPATSKNAEGRPKTAEDERPDTRPTPPPPPKPRAEAPPKPKEPERPTPIDTRPTKPKDEAPSETTPTKDGDKGRPPRDENGPTKPRADEDGTRPGPKRDGEGTGPGGRPKEPRRPRDRGDTDRPRKRPPDRDRQNKKDQQKKNDDSGDKRLKRLLKAVARIRSVLQKPMKKGIVRPVFLGELGGMRLYYRLSGLRPDGGKQFTVTAALTPYVEPVLPGEYSEPHSEPDAYSIPPGSPQPKDEEPRLRTGSPIVLSKKKYGFNYEGKATAVGKETVDFDGHATSGRGRFKLRKKGYPDDWTVAEYLRPFKLGQDFEDIRTNNSWRVYSPDARQSLNFRRHGEFREHVRGEFSWHHIVEQSSGLPYIDTLFNLTYTTQSINSSLSAWFNGKQPDSGRYGLPSTGGLKVRDYLNAIDADFALRERWGLRAIDERLSRRPKWRNEGRGPFKELF